MNYNFDEIVTRRGSNCIKWDEAEDPNIIPLWVADMDFHVYPGITEALRKRVEHDVLDIPSCRRPITMPSYAGSATVTEHADGSVNTSSQPLAWCPQYPR